MMPGEALLKDVIMNNVEANVDQFVKSNIDFLSAYFDSVDDGMSDGAWWFMLEDLAQSIINEYRIRLFDSNDLVHAYLRHKK